ncbi:hypothetical protein Tco_0790229 [Tanacetum coccineum]
MVGAISIRSASTIYPKCHHWVGLAVSLGTALNSTGSRYPGAGSSKTCSLRGDISAQENQSWGEGLVVSGDGRVMVKVAIGSVGEGCRQHAQQSCLHGCRIGAQD